MGELVEDRSLRDKPYVFKDRRDAGRRLTTLLAPRVEANALVLAIPAGGVPVAIEVARRLFLPMDLLIVRKIQIPGYPEAGFGAVGPEGGAVFNEVLLNRLGLTKEEIEEQVEEAKESIAARERILRGGRPFPSVAGRPTILVDDGLASGYTMGQAIMWVKGKGAGTITIAVPTAPERTVTRLLALVDEIYCLNIRSAPSFAVAEAYETWHDLNDQEVLSLLGKVEKH